MADDDTGVDVVRWPDLPIQRVIDAAKEWHASRPLSMKDIEKPGVWDRRLKAEAALSEAVEGLGE